MEIIKFDTLGLDPKILRAITEMGFEEPSPIQAKAIPEVMAGHDVIGQAQTGTGKTAAFGIPLLQKIDPKNRKLQAIILCPTRELAIQVADEIRRLSKFMHGIKILPVYGGQDIGKQIRSLKGGVQLVIGTPGRVMDHLRRRTLRFDNLHTIVLDEADEMLNMGFREDIETILKDAPEERQTVLFSATMPKPIMDITKNYQKDAVLVRVVKKELTVKNIDQYYYEVKQKNKEEVLSRLLDMYNPKLSLVFCNTKKRVDELTEALKGRGYFAEGLHGDMKQSQRDRVMKGFRSGKTEILIATDVAARGIDVDDVEAVFNYDVPQDDEFYVHRIGRTGRAGRAGRALLFVENRERRLLRNIERTMKLTIPEVELPNAELLGKRRLEKFAAKVQQQLESSDLDQYRALLSKIQPTAEGEELDLETLAAALLKMAQGERTLIVPPDAPMRPKREFRDRDDRGPRDRNDRGPRGDREDRPRRERRDVGDMQLYRIEVGRDDGVEVRHIVGAIANEGDISSRYIGNIKLFASHSTIELPKGMPGEVLQHFTRTRILNKPMNMQLLGDAQPHTGGERRGGGRGFGGERREGGRNFSGERREGGRGDGRRFSGERREGRAPRRDDSTGRRRFGGDA